MSNCPICSDEMATPARSCRKRECQSAALRRSVFTSDPQALDAVEASLAERDRQAEIDRLVEEQNREMNRKHWGSWDSLDALLVRDAIKPMFVGSNAHVIAWADPTLEEAAQRLAVETELRRVKSALGCERQRLLDRGQDPTRWGL